MLQCVVEDAGKGEEDVLMEVAPQINAQKSQFWRATQNHRQQVLCMEASSTVVQAGLGIEVQAQKTTNTFRLQVKVMYQRFHFLR